MNTLVTFFTALIAMASAIAFDQSLELMRKRSAETFIIGPRLWGGTGLDLLFVGLMLVSVWIIAFRFRPPRWASLALAFLTLIAMTGLPLAFSGLSFFQPALSRPLRALGLNITDFFPGTLLSLQATSIFLASVYAFFRTAQAKVAPEMPAA
jgi:hypothetical protein